ncbi:hypothetical protein XPN_3392, partial [Xanthomonas arboricola pv. pruni MAFF 301427]
HPGSAARLHCGQQLQPQERRERDERDPRRARQLPGIAVECRSRTARHPHRLDRRRTLARRPEPGRRVRDEGPDRRRRGGQVPAPGTARRRDRQAPGSRQAGHQAGAGAGRQSVVRARRRSGDPQAQVPRRRTGPARTQRRRRRTRRTRCPLRADECRNPAPVPAAGNRVEAEQGRV